MNYFTFWIHILSKLMKSQLNSMNIKQQDNSKKFSIFSYKTITENQKFLCTNSMRTLITSPPLSPHIRLLFRHVTNDHTRGNDNHMNHFLYLRKTELRNFLELSYWQWLDIATKHQPWCARLFHLTCTYLGFQCD